MHELGLREVARIHREMEAIMKQVGFTGDLQAFFKHLRTIKTFAGGDAEDGERGECDGRGDRA